jgi:cyclopropane fatty-acyl-phospholipid synthase-like methyltransferase
MLQMAGVRKKDVLYDLGSGDGRILIAAVQQFGVKAIGVELNDSLVRWAISRVERLDFQDKIHILRTNFFTVDLREADVVTMYLGSEANHLLRPKFEKELRPGTRVVSHQFQLEDWDPLEVNTLMVPETGRSHTVYLYRMSQKAQSSAFYRR